MCECTTVEKPMMCRDDPDVLYVCDRSRSGFQNQIPAKVNESRAVSLTWPLAAWTGPQSINIQIFNTTGPDWESKLLSD